MTLTALPRRAARITPDMLGALLAIAEHATLTVRQAMRTSDRETVRTCLAATAARALAATGRIS